MEGEFQDWELLQNSDPGLVNSQVSDEHSRNLEDIEGDAEGMIRSDYFSLDNQSRYSKNDAVSEEGSVESDNPSWIDPGLETRYERKNLTEFWSDSSSDRSDERKFDDFHVQNGSGFVDNLKGQVAFEGVGGMGCKTDDSGKPVTAVGEISDFELKNEVGLAEKEENRGDFQELGQVQLKDEGSEISSGDHMKKRDELGLLPDLDSGIGSMEKMEEGEGNLSGSESVVMASDVKSGGEGEKRSIEWWKVPLEVLKYCVFKVSPVWSFSVAAAVMGFVFLGRRLYKMKRKSQSLQLKVTLDDKFMSRAARLNEAFSVVRRVPIIRPSLPAAGVNPWPVMSLR